MQILIKKKSIKAWRESHKKTNCLSRLNQYCGSVQHSDLFSCVFNGENRCEQPPLYPGPPDIPPVLLRRTQTISVAWISAAWPPLGNWRPCNNQNAVVSGLADQMATFSGSPSHCTRTSRCLMKDRRLLNFMRGDAYKQYKRMPLMT